MLRKKKKNLWNKNLANKKQIHKKDCLDLTSELATAGGVSLSTLRCGQIGTVTKSHFLSTSADVVSPADRTISGLVYKK